LMILKLFLAPESNYVDSQSHPSKHPPLLLDPSF
jgi:hypothetical protein